MKFNTDLTSSRRKNRKAHFNTSQYNRRIRMSSSLSPELRAKYSFRSFPIVKNDEVKVISGKYKGRTGKVTNVSRREYKVYVEGCSRIINGQARGDPIDASNLQIVKFSMDFKRKEILEKKKEKFVERKIKAGRIAAN